MPRKSYSAEQQRIEREIARLRKRAEALQQKQRKPTITQIVRTMHAYSITPEDIATAFNSKRGSKTLARKVTNTVKREIPPKYRNPTTGATWTGRGKPPRWISEAEQAGTHRSQFLIQAVV